MTTNQQTIVGIGELLWECLPTGRQIGGAPANFAYIATQLGARGVVASRVGADADGDEIITLLNQRGLDTTFIQRDTTRATSRVEVSMSADGQATYAIHENVAWDYLTLTPEWEALANAANAVCFGSLAQRSDASRVAIRGFVAATRPAALRVFDVNLRQSFFDADVLRASLEMADAVKLNHEELPRIAALMGAGGRGDAAQAVRLREIFGLRFICVTRGKHGSLLVTQDETDEHPGLAANVADTVGAGDAFTAALVCQYLQGAPLAQINDAANRVGAWVASQTGGMPPARPGELRQLLAS